MSDIIGTITYGPYVPPAPVVVAKIMVTLSGPTPGELIVDPDTPSVTFTGLSPGDYTAVAVALDAGGMAIGAPTPPSNVITLPPEVTTVSVPISVALAIPVSTPTSVTLGA